MKISPTMRAPAPRTKTHMIASPQQETQPVGMALVRREPAAMPEGHAEVDVRREPEAETKAHWSGPRFGDGRVKVVQPLR